MSMAPLKRRSAQDLFAWCVDVILAIEEEPMRFSIFSVADHYPEEPRTIRDLYTQLLDEIELADELGFSAFFLAEHHFHEYGLVPSPPSLLGSPAGLTNQIGLAVAVPR